jgi:uncharacterized membrane protein
MEETSCPACGYEPARTGFQGGTQGQYANREPNQYTGQQRARGEEPWNRGPDRDPWENGAGRSRAYRGGSRQETQGAPNSAGPAQQEYKPADFMSADVAANRYLCILCYFGILFLIPLFLRKDSPYVRFHCNQGLLLMLTAALVELVSHFPVFGWAAGLAGGIFCLVSFFKGIGSTTKGRMDRLPIIGDINLIR